MVLLLFVFAYAATALRLNGFQPTAISDRFTISRVPRARSNAIVRSRELQVTSNVVNLMQKDAMSLSSMYVQAMRGSRGISRVTNGSTPLIAVEGGQVFLADVTVGGEPFQVVIDTGSSDLWLAVSGFQCFDPVTRASLEQSLCEFGSPYDPSLSVSFTTVPNQNFNISYADGEYLNGGLGLDTFSMAGIEVPKQQFGVVDIAAWYGDGISSGLIGFAYRTLTSAYAGTDPRADVRGRPIPYTPLFVNMYEQQNVPAIFSIAIDRNTSTGGVLALGGIPDIQHSPTFVTTPIQGVRVNATSGRQVYEFYTIDIDGYAMSEDRSTRFNSYEYIDSMKTPLVRNGSDTVVDSGTSLCYVPDDVAEATAALFDPPAYFDFDQNAYFVNCESRAPVFGVGIAKKIFYVNPADLIIRIQNNVCVMGIQSNGGGLSILGGTWLKNVLAVFDVEGEQMRFAARQFYDLYAK
ncbi:Putative aspartic peptidase A1 family, aspartic peptidase, active [Septoria linicola]|uniref:Aspartic peptidase A1 family, aspartic peptidase, active n=1 Tax=Septoria linicola TaxID=215465 RepID=A0A9Q9EFI9_9PEZI|nr:Putative aspartic peptidase A1 family, aspartic peptidase, active [Septoria linicola]